MSNEGVRLVSPDGEIIGELGAGDKIVKAKSIEYLKDTQVWAMEHFYKGNTDENRKQMKNLNVYEKAFIYSIVTYVGYEDCCIKYDNGKCLDFDDLVELSGMSRGKCSSTIMSLISKDIVYKGRCSKGIQYFVNPWMFCKGNRINKVLKTMFRNYRVKVMNDQRWGDMD